MVVLNGHEIMRKLDDDRTARREGRREEKEREKKKEKKKRRRKRRKKVNNDVFMTKNKVKS